MKAIDLIKREPAEFRKRLFIDTNDGAKPFASVMDDWQHKDFIALDDGWKCVARRGRWNPQAPKRAYLERPRGHSKTTDFAVMAAWALFATERKIDGVAAACDRDQARLLRDAVDKIVRLPENAWLSKYLDVQSYRVVNRETGSTLSILSADDSSSYGLTPSFVLYDEVSHAAADGLFVSLYSAAAKTANCMFVTITNAGFGMGTSWQWTFREAARTGEAWYFNSLDGVQASWISTAELAEQKRILPKLAYQRLWENKWTTGSGDALTDDQIAKAFGDLHCQRPANNFDRGTQFVAGMDLGVRADSSALVVLAVPPSGGRIELAYSEVWQPPEGGEVRLQDVEDKVVELHKQYRFPLYFDWWQAAHMAQRLQELGLRLTQVSQQGNDRRGMTGAMLEAFRDEQISLYGDDLRQDLARLKVTESRGGYMLTAKRTDDGHADLATALAIALFGIRKDIGDLNGRPGIYTPNAEELATAGEKYRAVLKSAMERVGAAGSVDDDKPERGWKRIFSTKGW